MKQLLTKIWNDTFCNPQGKVSRKNLTMFFSFASMMFFMYLEVFTTMPILTMFQIKVPAHIYYTLAGIAGGHSALTVYDKIKNKPPGS
jgi:hypothetical protein